MSKGRETNAAHLLAADHSILPQMKQWTAKYVKRCNNFCSPTSIQKVPLKLNFRTTHEWTLTNRDTKQLNIFERKVYGRILGPVYDNEKENWRLITNKEIYSSVKKPTIIETIKLHRLCWFGHVQRMEENRISKRVLYMNLGTTRLRGRPRNRWQHEVREDGRIVGGEGGRKKYITERNRRSSWERQWIIAFCTCQWNEWMSEWINGQMDDKLPLRSSYTVLTMVQSILLVNKKYRKNLYWKLLLFTSHSRTSSTSSCGGEPFLIIYKYTCKCLANTSHRAKDR